MNLFTILRQHALIHPEAIATSSRYRMMTYRKLWSRVERATARLQAEWHVKSGDNVVYLGQGHPDALVLYVALARCGAHLIPLEKVELQLRSDAIMRDYNVKLVLHDDHASGESIDHGPVSKPLSALIMTRCPYQSSSIIEEPSRASLLTLNAMADGSIESRLKSLDQMTEEKFSEQDQLFQETRNLFDEDVFVSIVLPALLSGSTLLFN